MDRTTAGKAKVSRLEELKEKSADGTITDDEYKELVSHMEDDMASVKSRELSINEITKKEIDNNNAVQNCE